MKINSLFLLFPSMLALAATIHPLGAQSTPAPAGTADPQATTQTFIIAGLDCPKCVMTAETALKKLPGVTAATVEFPSGETRMVTANHLTQELLRTTLGPHGLEPRFPGDPPEVALSDAEKAGLDIAVVGSGKRVDYDRLPVGGKVTIVDFYGDWCSPCRLLAIKLERLVKADPRVALRQVDLAAWDSETAAQASEKFHFPGLPYIRVYGHDGKFLGAVSGVQMNEITRLVALGEKS